MLTYWSERENILPAWLNMPICRKLQAYDMHLNLGQIQQLTILLNT